jgi:hypothetical protein
MISFAASTLETAGWAERHGERLVVWVWGAGTCASMGVKVLSREEMESRLASQE